MNSLSLPIMGLITVALDMLACHFKAPFTVRVSTFFLMLLLIVLEVHAIYVEEGLLVASSIVVLGALAATYLVRRIA